MNNFEWHHRFADPIAERLSPYFSRLFVILGQHSLQFAILNSETNMFVALSDLKLKTNLKGPILYAEHLRQFFLEEGLLQKQYSSVTIGVETPVNTLVPSAMFDRDHLKHYLRFHFQLPEEHPLFCEHIPEVDAYNIHSIDPATLAVIREFFPEATMMHSGTSLVRSCYQEYRLNQRPVCLFLHIREPYIDLCCIGENGLLFFNSFACHSKEDLLYFTLYAMDQLRLRVEDTTVNISGFIEKETDAYALLSQYIPELSFTTRPGPAVYSPVLHSLPGHFYQPLFGLALCGS